MLRKPSEVQQDIRWDDGKAIHACEGARIVVSDPGTFVVWTRCEQDVPANAGFRENGEAVTCQKCASVESRSDG
jgi:hypothetical protein